MWEQPILHVPVNKPDGSKWGVPDAYAALPWAKAYEGFLTSTNGAAGPHWFYRVSGSLFP